MVLLAEMVKQVLVAVQIKNSDASQKAVVNEKKIIKKTYLTGQVK